jgi:hypothetical protein
MPAASPLRRAEDAIAFAPGLAAEQATRQLAADGPTSFAPPGRAHSSTSPSRLSASRCFCC